MFTAITIDNLKVEPSYNVITFCENCGHRLRPKCVTPDKVYLKRKHFFHESGVCCDNWYEPTSEWHYEWQSHVPLDQREVSIDNGHDRHIADILLTLPQPPIVVELQKSDIPFDVKLKRDVFYNRVFWVVHKDLQTRTWVASSNKPVFIDLLDETIRTPFGTIITKEQFITDVLHNPNLIYEDWLYGVNNEEIITKFGKTKRRDIVKGDKLVFLKSDCFISQCFVCKHPSHQRQNLTDILYINDVPHFQCMFCGKIYEAYLVPDDPRGEDDEIEKRRLYRQLIPYFGNTRRRIWEQHKTDKRILQPVVIA